MHTTYYRAEGRSLAIIRDWLAASKDFTIKLQTLRQELGALSVSHNGPQTAFMFPAQADLPKHLRRLRLEGHGHLAVPDLRYKAGRELDARLSEGKPMDHRALTIELLGGLHVLGNREGNLWLGTISFDLVGDDIVIEVPHLGDGEPVGDPVDAVKLKRSEYWQMKEALEDSDDG